MANINQVQGNGRHYAIVIEPPVADTSHVKRKYLDLPYARLSSAEKLDIYLPDEGEGPFPVIGSTHGGAFMGCDKADLQVLPMLLGFEKRLRCRSDQLSLERGGKIPGTGSRRESRDPLDPGQCLPLSFRSGPDRCVGWIGRGIPRVHACELRKILTDNKEEIKILVKIIKNSLSIKIAEMEVYIRLIDKKFPEYKYIIPQPGENEITVKAEKEKIKPALKRMSIIASENKRPVNFKLNGKQIEISTEDSELGSVNESIEMEEAIKKEIFFSINGRYFLDILNAIDDDVLLGNKSG